MGRRFMVKDMNREAVDTANSGWLSKILFRSVAPGLGIPRNI